MNSPLASINTLFGEIIVIRIVFELKINLRFAVEFVHAQNSCLAESVDSPC